MNRCISVASEKQFITGTICTMTVSARIVLPALLALSMIAWGCTTTDPRDIPLSEVNALDTATREKALGTLTEGEREWLILAAKAYGNDSNALNRRTINQLIDEGEALDRNKPLYTR